MMVHFFRQKGNCFAVLESDQEASSLEFTTSLPHHLNVLYRGEYQR